ncbi:MAG: 3-hydroxyacyl-CoA dehydrogenase/enoyl-CoA hydratase/3-hydroxybutyryl-CoA epimerase, partial [Alphaproteobacteria bacterium]
MRGTHWQSERRADGVHVLTIDVADARVNVLSAPVLTELDTILDAFERDVPKGLIICSGKPTGFIAGADISEFTQFTSADAARAAIARGQGVMNRIAKLRFPTVARIHGFCMGGGLELALACRARVARSDARLGLPEVQLGIHPGFGGAARLTRIIPAHDAMGLMLQGRLVDARTAKRMGFVDWVGEERHLDAAVEAALARPPKRVHAAWKLAVLNMLPARWLLARVMRKQVAAKASRKHYPAPYALIDLWARAGGSEQAMLAGEVSSIAQLIQTDTARNLVRVFFLRERLKGLAKSAGKPFRHVHVIGAGVMGGDIAAWCALQGLTVTLQDREAKFIAPAIKRAAALFKRRLRDPAKVRDAMDRLIPDVHGDGIARADVVIEAIIEDTRAKQDLFRMVEAKARPDALLASNTSSIPLEDIAAVLDAPERLIGIHFFNPVAQLPLIEIVAGAASNVDSVTRGQGFAGRIDRLPVTVKSAPGFLVNRALMPYLIEAVRLMEEGVAPVALDRAATDFGMPMGPIELADTVGLDICLHVAETLGARIGAEVPAQLKEMVAAGKLGRKTGEGFYTWRDGRAVKPKAPDLEEPSTIPDDLTDRLILPILNTCAACLGEGMVADADLADAAMIFGTGFAPFRGGPLHYAQARGISDVRARLSALEALHGARYRPSDGWDKLAAPAPLP